MREPTDRFCLPIARLTSGDVDVAVDESECVVIRFPDHTFTVTDVDRLVTVLQLAKADRDTRTADEPPPVDERLLEIARLLDGYVRHGSGALASAEPWASRYTRDVGYLLGLYGVTLPVIPISPPEPEPTREWGEWEEGLGLRILDWADFQDVDGGVGLTRADFVKRYAAAHTKGRVDAALPGHTRIIGEVLAATHEEGG